MAFIEKRNQTYMADTKEDLQFIKDEMGSKCYVIKEGATYTLTSEGEWVKRTTSGNGANSSIDLSDYITSADLERALESTVSDAELDQKVKNFVDKQDFEHLQKNPVLSFFNLARNPAMHDAQSIYLTKDGSSLKDAMIKKGLSVSNVWIEKGNNCLPKTMLSDNTSGRGIAVVDFQQDGDTIGYAILFDKKNNMYYQFLNHNEAGPWMKVSATED